MFGPAGLRGAGTLDTQVDPRAEEEGRKIFRPYAGGSGSRERVTTPGGRRSSVSPRPRASPARSPDPVRYPLERQGCELFEAPGRHSCSSGNPEHGRLLARTCADVTRMQPASGSSRIDIPSEDMPNPQQERQSGRPRRRTCTAWLCVWATGLFTACDLLTPPLHGHREIAAAVRPLLNLGYAEPDSPTYHAAFLSFRDVVRAQMDATPHEMRPFVERILGLCRSPTRCWLGRSGRPEPSGPAAPRLARWTERYPFLDAAGGDAAGGDAAGGDAAGGGVFQGMDATVSLMRSSSIRKSGTL